MKDDKIFGNKFNTGEIEYVPFPSIRIDTPENLDILDDYNALEMQKCLLDKMLFQEQNHKQQMLLEHTNLIQQLVAIN